MNEDKNWHSPAKAYSDYLRLAEEVGIEAIEQDGGYQKVYETRVLSILCFALFVAQDISYFLQICRNDPPDELIMRLSPKSKGTMEIMQVEVTSYLRHKGKIPKISVLEQLKKTKAFESYHKYSEHDIVLVDLGLHYEVDFKEIHDYLVSIKAPYGLWFLQETQSSPDTIAELTICDAHNQYVVQKQLNIGEAWDKYKKLNIPGSLYTERVANVDKVRMEKNDRKVGAPWETCNS